MFHKILATRYIRAKNIYTGEHSYGRMRESISIRFAGKGGQGIIFSGVALARAFSLYENGSDKEYYAYQTQSYGPEARGGSCKCDVKVSTDRDTYPFVEVPDYLVAMSQEAFERYIQSTTGDTILFLDRGQVEGKNDHRTYLVPATEKADELEAKIVANVIILGAFVEITEMISKKAVHKALHDISPRGTKKLNEKAFRIGNSLAKEILEGNSSKD